MRITVEAMPRYGRPRRWYGFAHRNRGTVILSAMGVGVNFHRKGGVSFTGLPSTGGTTICWGRLRERCERMDHERDGMNLRYYFNHFGVMVRVGRDF